jgi:hypothetical protein
MAWDKTLPSGSADIAAGDNAIRDNNQALETAIGTEHEFSTGGTNAGRHKFAKGTTAAREAITTWAEGSIYFNTSPISGEIVLQRYNGTTWEDIDVFQSDIPRTDEQSLYTVAQQATWASVTPGAGSPDTLAIDLALSPRKYATIVGDTIISNPTNAVASNGCDVILDLTMSGAGHVITFGSGYRSMGGIAPVVASANGAITRLYISSMQASGVYLVATAPGLAAF